MRAPAAALALLVAALCAPTASAAVLDGPSDDLRAVATAGARGASSAVLALLDAADQALRAGQPQQAATLLERALRIDPRNPAAWHYLGLARLELGDYEQAEALAAKSHNLAGGDRRLRTRNAGLLAAAQRAAGKPVSVASIEPPASRSWFDDVRVEPARVYTGLRERYETLFADPQRARRAEPEQRREIAEPRGGCFMYFSDRRATVRCDDARSEAPSRPRTIVVPSRSSENDARERRRYRSSSTRTLRQL